MQVYYNVIPVRENMEPALEAMLCKTLLHFLSFPLTILLIMYVHELLLI